jgi:mRNA interferase MazF
MKDFPTWFKRKTWIHNNARRIYFHEREIWFAHLGVNVGFEQDGKGTKFGRPVVIFRKFNNEVFWAVPLTSKEKSGKFYLSLGQNEKYSYTAILSQLRLMDSKRLYKKIGTIDKIRAHELETKIIILCRGG